MSKIVQRVRIRKGIVVNQTLPKVHHTLNPGLNQIDHLPTRKLVRKLIQAQNTKKILLLLHCLLNLALNLILNPKITRKNSQIHLHHQIYHQVVLDPNHINIHILNLNLSQVNHIAQTKKKYLQLMVERNQDQTLVQSSIKSNPNSHRTKNIDLS